MKKDIECPYCGYDQKINHDDGYGYGDDLYKQQCIRCENNFTYRTEMSFSYDTYKADCLNDVNHTWELPSYYTKEYERAAKMKCKVCEDERILTDEERKIFFNDK